MAKAGKLGEKEVSVAAGVVGTDPPPTKEAAPLPLTEAKAGETAILAPMPGMMLSCDTKVGDEVKTGDTVVVLEAMKMAIDLPAPVSGQVKAINFKSGDRVAKDDVLAIIG